MEASTIPATAALGPHAGRAAVRRARCCACAPTSSSCASSAPATTRPSASSTTATARACSPTRGRCSAARAQDAEDALQDVFVRAYGALRANDRDVSLRAWLYRIAHNRCIDELRRPRRRRRRPRRSS